MSHDQFHHPTMDQNAAVSSVSRGACVSGAGPDGPPAISIIIPVYNACELTRACLASIQQHSGPYRWEVILVDNASSDGTRFLLSDLPTGMRAIRNPSNVGFARACNQAALQAQGTYLLFLNNDTIVTAGWIEPLLKAVQRPGTGIVGCKLLYPDGRIQHAGIAMINGIPDHPYRHAAADLPATCLLREMDMVTGACLMVRRALFAALRGFDELYRNGVEDVDLCLRVRQAGYRVVYQPESIIYHYEGQSAGRFNHVRHNLSVFDRRWREFFSDDGGFRVRHPLRLMPAQKSIMAENRPRIVWEGSQFVHHSLALVNRELCLRLIEWGCEVSLLPYERDQFSVQDEPRFEPLAQRTRAPLSGPADVHVRHQWPPHFTPPPEGHWVIIQPWEFGSLPKDWVGPMSEDVDEIWVPSHFVRDSYIQSGVPAEKVSVLPNGVNTRLLRPGLCPYPLKTQKKFKFLFVGGTIRRKGIDILLDVYTKTFSSTDDVCLVIKDMGGDTFYKGQTARQLIDRYRSTPGAPEIEHIEHTLDEIEMAGLYNACDGLVHPYRGEGFGLPIAEAMACELPVIVTGIGAALDYCTPDNSFLVPARILRSSEKRIGEAETVDYPWLAEPDRESLQAIMKQLVDGPAEAKAKAKAARETIEAEFTWDHAAQSVMQRLGEIALKPIARRSRPLKLFPPPIEPTVSIVIRLSDEVNAIKQCYQQIQKNTRVPYQVVWVDNHAPAKLLKWLKQAVKKNANCRYVQVRKGAGWAAENNYGIQVSSGAHILLLDSRALVVNENWISDLLECLRGCPQIGVVGAVYDPTDNGLISSNSISTRNENPQLFAAEFRKRNRHRRIPVERVNNGCMLFKRQLIEEIGPFDDAFEEGAIAAEDFCLRAALAGYQNALAGDVYLHSSAGIQCVERRAGQQRRMGHRRSFNEKWHGADSLQRFGQKLGIYNALAQADELYRQGDFEKAVSALVAVLQQAPSDRNLYFKLAEMLMGRGRYPDALGILEAVPDGGGNARQMALLGCCAEALGQAGNAETYAERALAVDPRSVLAMNVKGRVAFKRGERAAAEGWFKMAIESDRCSGEAYTHLGSLKSAAGELGEALHLFERGFVLSPTVRDVATAYHAAVVETQSFAPAATVICEAWEAHPKDKSLLFFLIAVLIQDKQYERAMPAIEQAMRQYGIDDGILSASLDVRRRIGPHDRTQTLEAGGTLSLCMIVKNEEEHLARCLTSVKPMVDEIIVVDTGSTDRTKKIAAAFGAKVFAFDWTDDFSAARNFSILNATGQWVFILDADECISIADHALIRKLIYPKEAKRVGYRIATRNYTHEAGTRGWIENDGRYSDMESGVGWFPSSKVRLFPKAPGIRFVNPVHEIVDPSLQEAGYRIIDCDVPVHHYGKLCQTKVIEKGRHYYRLGLQKLEALRGDYIALKELAIQASEIGEYGQAVKIWQDVLQMKPEDASALMNLGYAHLKLKDYTNAIKVSQKAMEVCPESREAALNYSAAELMGGNPQNAVRVLGQLLRKQPDYPPAMGRLAAALIVSGLKNEAMPYLDRLQEKCYDCARTLEEQAQEFYGNGQLSLAAALLEAAQEKGMINGRIQALLVECREKMASEAKAHESGNAAFGRRLQRVEAETPPPALP